jgi:hypothetical protein
MAQLKSLLILSTISGIMWSWQISSDNSILGTWQSYKLIPLARRATVSDSLKKNFQSTISFNNDSIYIKITNGVKTLGKYKLESNRLTFYRKNEKGQWTHDWLMRWPKGDKDPYPMTKEIDIDYLELLPIINKKGEKVIGEVDVLYSKVQ